MDPIDDKFREAKTKSGKPMTKQQRYAQRRREQGLCVLCSNPAEPSKSDPKKCGPYCLHHKIDNRERARRRLKSRRRWANASSYEKTEGGQNG